MLNQSVWYKNHITVEFLSLGADNFLGEVTKEVSYEAS
jgi:hypothetical protein